MRVTRIITILDVWDRYYDRKPFKPRGHKCMNGYRVKAGGIRL